MEQPSDLSTGIAYSGRFLPCGHRSPRSSRVRPPRWRCHPADRAWAYRDRHYCDRVPSATAGRRTPAGSNARYSRERANLLLLSLWLLIENGSKITRGKKAVREQIDSQLAATFEGRKLNDTETRLVIRYVYKADLKQQIDDMLAKDHQIVDLRTCEVRPDPQG